MNADGIPAAPEFRDRGLAALRRDGEGNITLDQGVRSSKSQALRVQIEPSGTVFASAISTTEDMAGEESIEKLILQARDSIYDEELHHELHREARTLANQGVRCMGDVIHLPYEHNKHVLLDLIPYDQAAQPSEESALEDNWVPTAIALAARLLLSHAHRQNLRRRSQPPPPLTERRSPRPTYSILRPILAHLQHRSCLASMRDFLSGLSRTLAAADSSFEYDEAVSTSIDLSNVSEMVARTGSPTAEVLGNTLTAPLQTSITLVVPSQSTNITINLRTHLSAPLFGTNYQVTITSSPPNSVISQMPPSMHFVSANDAEDHILHLLTLDLVSTIASVQLGNMWVVKSAHTGELRMTPNEKGKKKWMVVTVGRQKVELQWGLTNVAGSEMKNYVWEGGDDADEEMAGRTLEEVVREAGAEAEAA